MRFFQYLTAALVPVAVVAGPAAKAEAEAVAAPHQSMGDANVAAMISMMRENQEMQKRNGEDLTGLLGQLPDLLNAFGKLLNDDFLNDVHSVVTQAAYLLGGDTAKEAKTLLSTASSLLTPGLINELGGLLNNANNLLTPKLVRQTKGLINNVAPLVSAISQVISVLLSALLGDGK